MPDTTIEWTATRRPDGTLAPGFTFNPWRGCTKVHEGCANCYAESMSKRNPGTLGIWGPNGSRVVAAESYWKQPLTWNRKAEKEGIRLKVFCASLADVFEDWDGPISDHHGRQLFTINGEEWFTEGEYPDCQPLTMHDVRRRLFALIDATPHLDWLLLTKRPENIQRMWCHAINQDWFCGVQRSPEESFTEWNRRLVRSEIRRPNVWLGTSISLQEHADKQIPDLLQCRDLAPVLFLSIEPLLGHIHLDELLYCQECFGTRLANDGPQGEEKKCLDCCGHPLIDWVICGGESGPGARIYRPEWPRNIIKQCRDAGIAVFHKQMGSKVVTRNDMVEDTFSCMETGWPDPYVEHDIHGFRENYQGADCRIRLKDKKGSDINEWPEDLRVRQFPEPERTRQ